MNSPPQDFTTIDAQRLRDFSADCLRGSGLRPDHVDQIAGLLVDSDLRGVRSHGVRLLTGYVRFLGNGDYNPSPEIRILHETDTAVLLHGDGGLGYVPMMMATEAAITKARRHGMASGAVCRIGHYGAAGHYVRRAVDAGFFAFSVQGAHPDFERKRDLRLPAAYWGNPPFCFGLPAGDEPAVILDGGTTLVADCRDEDLQERIPAVFFKSMGLTAVATALGGAFVGMSATEASSDTDPWKGGRAGGWIFVVDIGLHVPPQEFRAGVDHLVRGVRDTMSPVCGYDRADLPGAIEARLEQEYRRSGIPVGAEDVAQLNEAAATLGIPPLT